MGAEAIKGETVFLAGPCLCSGDCGRGTPKLSVHLPTAKEVGALPGPILQMRKMRFRNLLKVPQPFSGRDVVPARAAPPEATVSLHLPNRCSLTFPVSFTQCLLRPLARLTEAQTPLAASRQARPGQARVGIAAGPLEGLSKEEGGRPFGGAGWGGWGALAVEAEPDARESWGAGRLLWGGRPVFLEEVDGGFPTCSFSVLLPHPQALDSLWQQAISSFF